MRTTFFIACLPRSGSAWLSNYLTYGNTFCFHDALKHCFSDGPTHLKEVFDKVDTKYVGNADPANVLFQDCLIREFPSSKWVIIEREYKESEEAIRKLGLKPNGLPSIQVKLEELRGKLNPLVIPYRELTNRADEIGEYVNENWRSLHERLAMLSDMNVQAEPEKAMKALFAIPEVNALRTNIEYPQMTQTNRDFLALVQQICQSEPLAYKWFHQIIEAALVWDHLVDGEAIDPQMANRVMSALITEWPLNGFVQRYAQTLIPVIVNAISAWKHSYEKDEPKIKALDIYSEIPTTIAFILGGMEMVNHYSPQIRAFVHKLAAEDFARDGGKK